MHPLLVWHRILNADGVYAHEIMLRTAIGVLGDTVADTCYGDIVYVDRTDTERLHSSGVPVHITRDFSIRAGCQFFCPESRLGEIRHVQRRLGFCCRLRVDVVTFSSEEWDQYRSCSSDPDKDMLGRKEQDFAEAAHNC